MLTPFGQRFTATAPFRPVHIRQVVAEGDRVVVLWDGEGETIAGTTYPAGPEIQSCRCSESPQWTGTSTAAATTGKARTQPSTTSSSSATGIGDDVAPFIRYGG